MNIYLIFRAYVSVPNLPTYFIYVYIILLGKFGTFGYILFFKMFFKLYI